MDEQLSQSYVSALVARNFRASEGYRTTLKARRLLVNRNPGVDEFNLTGTLLPAPFQQSTLALRTMVNEPNRVVNHYKSRLSTNMPDISVLPLTTKTEINATTERLAGEQERLDNQLWIENGGKDALNRLAAAMSLAGVGYIGTMPRDANFGLPDRIYYSDLTDDDVERMRREGKIGRVKVVEPKTGQLVYAEPGDVWASRRDEVAKQRAVSGSGLFPLKVFPADMVVCENDDDSPNIGPKWLAAVQEIPSDAIAEGSDIAQSWADMNGKDRREMWGLFTDKNGRIVGGINNGGPVGTDWRRSDIYTLILFYSRTEYIVLVAPQGSIEGAEVVWRGEHGCTIQGIPACPFEEVPFFKSDVDIPGGKFSTPVSDVMAWAPLVNQLLTVGSNATTFNGIPRWVIELQNGSTLRDDDGEPVMVHSGQVPGLDPAQAAAYPGTLKQLTINTDSLLKLIEIYLEKLQGAMPSPITTGAEGASGAAWTANLLISQAQQDLVQPSENICIAIQRLVQRWHGWMRQLDVPVYFYSAPGHRKTKKTQRNLIEFDPKDLTDSIQVSQDLDTPDEATVRLQIGIELLTGGPNGTSLITLEEFYDKYAKVQDSRQAVIDYWVDQVVKAVMEGVPAQPGSVVQIVADGVRGQLHYELIQQSPNYAISVAENMASQAQQSLQPQPQQGGNVAAAAGIRRPGMGMANTLQGQLGSRIQPGGDLAV